VSGEWVCKRLLTMENHSVSKAQALILVLGNREMTKSELIERIAKKQPHLPYKDVELSVKTLIEQMAQKLSTGNRIEIRGFGSFSLHFRPPRVGRNPKTGEAVSLSGKYVPHFKPGKELREKVNNVVK